MTPTLFLFRFFESELMAWRGLLPLWRVFWVYGILASIGLIGIYAVALSERQIVVQQALLIVFPAYTVWSLVSVWRCAATSDPHWGSIARCLTVAWAGNAALVVLFLQLDLLTAFTAS